MKNKDIIEVVLPAWSINYIINGDDEGLTEREKRNVDNFLDFNNIESISPVSEEPYFSWNNDIDDMGADVYDCTALVKTKTN